MNLSAAEHLGWVLGDPGVIARYWAKVDMTNPEGCWLWTGAISGKGHGRFWIAATRQSAGAQRNYVVLAHRFGYALAYGLETLLAAEVLAHGCDSPLCQRTHPRHVRASTHEQNRREWASRRHIPGGALDDRRGSRARAQALRAAARAGTDPELAHQAGLWPIHRDQPALFSTDPDDDTASGDR